MLIDTHSHLDFKEFEKDRDEVISRAFRGGVEKIINVGTNFESSKKVVEITEKYKKGVYGAIGLHPINIIQNSKVKNQNDNSKCKIPEDILEEDFDYEEYKDLAKSKKVVAVGEIGLDYWSKPKTKKKQEIFKQKQKEIFLKQLNLAKELNLPVIFHCRLAHQDLIQTLQHPNTPTIRGVIHCFTGNWQQAKKYLEMGFYLGFNGIIFKLNLEEVIKKTPLERILIETDCPFLAPSQINTKRNEPLYVKHIAQKIAEIKKEKFEKVYQITTENAKGLFKL
ncbi:MAG: TatD family hydrolase [Patescibacteria group bacterium]|nr:TatD family hydrolase [Patescibacteria group bacterium]